MRRQPAATGELAQRLADMPHGLRAGLELHHVPGADAQVVLPGDLDACPPAEHHEHLVDLDVRGHPCAVFPQPAGHLRDRGFPHCCRGLARAYLLGRQRLMVQRVGVEEDVRCHVGSLSGELVHFFT